MLLFLEIIKWTFLVLYGLLQLAFGVIFLIASWEAQTMD